MVKIDVEFLSKPGAPPQRVELSRVPCVGEWLMLLGDDGPKLVHDVYHYADTVCNDIAAVVRVKG